ncbi:Hypothetical protein CINCED_3A025412 [Cinara cedri]|uniref:CUB domain-containing protein n=1 Tax=Cinara cedri TaxID=506608 RepID=A0A5E4MMT8_9HEMI|nr:Hypothetical protein CINCED_3A025412 [Cinara cedri]
MLVYFDIYSAGWNSMAAGKHSCNGFNGQSGVCMVQNECAKLNGKSVGKCFPYGSCCSVVSESCGGYSDLSTSYFKNPDKFQEVCVYKINIKQKICQIRIDFERFSLGQPTKSTNQSAYACEHDEFTVFSNDNTIMNLPVLCGENSGQHVYVPLNPHTSSDLNDRQQITLRFRLTTRDDKYNDPTPFWKLKISQLECTPTIMPTKRWKSTDDDAVRQVSSSEEKENSKYSLAPDGCLQYFTDEDGSFESFNYHKGQGHYLGNLNYAVCFKRNVTTCGIKFEAVKFQMAYNQNLTRFTERDCDTAKIIAASQTTEDVRTAESPSETETAHLHNDYLLIPDGRYSAEKLFASKYCDGSLEHIDDVKIKTRGPLYVAFISDDYSSPDEDVEIGYKINYSIMNTGC